MQYRTLGRTRLSVSCVSYGTNMLGRRPSPDRPDDEECTTEEYYIRMVRTALDEGVNLLRYPYLTYGAGGLYGGMHRYAGPSGQCPVLSGQ